MPGRSMYGSIGSIGSTGLLTMRANALTWMYRLLTRSDLMYAQRFGVMKLHLLTDFSQLRQVATVGEV